MNNAGTHKTKKILFSVSLVIPIYNNAKTAEKLLAECHFILQDLCRKYEIILCNDASFDNTKTVIEKFAKNHQNTYIINHKKNGGIAKSLRDLYIEAKNDYTILFSVDGGWDPNDIKNLILAINMEKTDIIIGKRKKKKYNLFRNFVSFMYNLFPLLLFGTKTYDTGSIKIFKSEIFKNTKLQSESVFFEAEFLIKARKNGHSIGTIPVLHRESLHKTKNGVNFNEVKKAFLDMIRLRFNYN